MFRIVTLGYRVGSSGWNSVALIADLCLSLLRRHFVDDRRSTRDSIPTFHHFVRTAAFLHALTVRGLFSAMMPMSSFAGVRRVLVSHMEDEDDQENEKEDGRVDGQQRL